MNKTFIPKEHPDLPDSYKITVHMLNGKDMEYEAVEHHPVNLVYEPFKQADRTIAHRLVGAHPKPFFEVWTKENKLITIPMDVGILEFDERYTKIIELKKTKNGGPK